MADEPATEAAPAFVVRMQVAIAAAVARHRDQLDVHHEHLEAGVDGWQSKLSFAGHPEVEAVFWYDSADRDVMFWGDAPYREWFLLADGGDETLDEQDVEVCLREMQQVIDDLAGPGRDGVLAQAARRTRLDARPRWRRLLLPRAAERWP